MLYSKFHIYHRVSIIRLHSTVYIITSLVYYLHGDYLQKYK